MWEIIAKVIEAIANLGAGAASGGIAYEPELPEELKKQLPEKSRRYFIGGFFHVHVFKKLKILRWP